MSRIPLHAVADLDDVETFAPIGRAQVGRPSPASSRPDGDRTRAARDLAIARRAARRAARTVRGMAA